MASRSELLSRVRAKQQLLETSRQAPENPLRFILEFEAPRDPAEVAHEIEERLGIAVTASRLSEAHGESVASGEDGLANFLAVTIAGVAASDVPDSPFELGSALADATGAVTAEPELGTDFYVAPEASGGQPEGFNNFPPGCWVDPSQDPTGVQPLWAVKKIKASDAWSLPAPQGGKKKGEGIQVFQPDTGVADHQELGGGMLGTALAYDFVDGKPGAVDPMNYSGNRGHGTGTASVVASREAGAMVGAAPLATLVPLRAVRSVVVFDHGRVAAAVDYARRKGANVISMSLGGAWSSSLRAAIRKAINDGVIVLAAAGNCVGFVVWPARYPEVIAVAGYNIHDQPWKGTCRGEAVDITAPGEFVPRANGSPDNGGSLTDVRGGQGTSFAVALTAGVAALWLGYHGVGAIKASLASGESVQDRFVGLLKATAWQPSGWPAKTFGAGIVDAKRLLAEALGAPEGRPEALVAEADPLRSVHTLLAEVASTTLEAVTEATAGPPSSRRYAAELSHLAFLKQMRVTTGKPELAQAEISTPPSETLASALTASGRVDLLEALRRTV